MPAAPGQTQPARKHSPWRRLTSDLGFACLSLLIALAIGFLFLLLTGKDALQAYSVLLAGPLARLPRTGRWLDVACNLTVAGLAFAIPYRARLINFGVASQALMGGFAAAIAAGLVGVPIAAQLAAVCAAMLAGFAFGVMPGAMKAYLGANEIVVTLMLSFIASQLLSLALDAMFAAGLFGFFRGLGLHNGFPQIREVTDLATGTFHLGVVVVVVAVLAAWLLMERTPFGYAVRMTGANERFARYGGINTRRATMLAFGVGGAFAGLAGANLALGAPRDVFVSVVGLTFDAIVVALLARSQPLLVPLAALAYGYLSVGADFMEVQTSVGQEVVRVIQGVIVLLLSVQAWGERRRAQPVDP
jgi:simple sugar transport system permease protein